MKQTTNYEYLIWGMVIPYLTMLILMHCFGYELRTDGKKINILVIQIICYQNIQHFFFHPCPF